LRDAENEIPGGKSEKDSVHGVWRYSGLAKRESRVFDLLGRSCHWREPNQHPGVPRYRRPHGPVSPVSRAGSERRRKSDATGVNEHKNPDSIDAVESTRESQPADDHKNFSKTKPQSFPICVNRVSHALKIW